MKRNALWLLAAVLAIGLIAAGCGDDDDDGDEGGDAPTKEEFIAEADQICSDGDAEIEAAAEETFGQSDQPPTAAEQEQFAADEVIPNIQEQVDGIDELTPPEGDEDQVQAIVDAAREGLEAGKEDPSLFLGNEDPLAEASQLARDYGLTACGEGEGG